MKYTENKSYKQPERTLANDDAADINDLSENFAAVDGDITAVEASLAGTQASLSSHLASRANPHGVTAAQAGAYTRAEVDERVAGYDAHVADTGNPHDTTAAQVGAYSVGEANTLLDAKVSHVDADARYLQYGDGGHASYRHMVVPNGQQYLRLGGTSQTASGLLPYAQSSAGHGRVGAASWPFYQMYTKNLGDASTHVDTAYVDSTVGDLQGNAATASALRDFARVPSGGMDLNECVVEGTSLGVSGPAVKLWVCGADGYAASCTNMPPVGTQRSFQLEVRLVRSNGAADYRNVQTLFYADSTTNSDTNKSVWRRYMYETTASGRVFSEWERLGAGVDFKNTEQMNAWLLRQSLYASGTFSTSDTGISGLLSGGATTGTIKGYWWKSAASSVDFSFIAGATSPVFYVARYNASTGTLTSSGNTDARYVMLSGAQTVGGVKTFSSSPVVPTPSAATQAANKQYVDSVAGGRGPEYVNGGQLAHAYFPADAGSVMYWQKLADIQMSTDLNNQTADITFEFRVAGSGSTSNSSLVAQTYGNLYVRAGTAGEITGTQLNLITGYDFADYATINLVAVVSETTTGLVSLWSNVRTNYGLTKLRVITSTALNPASKNYTETYYSPGSSAAVTALPAGTVVQPVYRGNSGKNLHFSDQAGMNAQLVAQATDATGTFSCAASVTQLLTGGGYNVSAKGIWYKNSAAIADVWVLPAGTGKSYQVRINPQTGVITSTYNSSSSLYFTSQANMDEQLLAQANNANGTFLADTEATSILTQGAYSNLAWGTWEKSSSSTVRMGFTVGQSATFAQRHSVAYNPTAGTVSTYANTDSRYLMLTGEQTVAGTKSFSSSINAPGLTRPSGQLTLGGNYSTSATGADIVFATDGDNTLAIRNDAFYTASAKNGLVDLGLTNNRFNHGYFAGTVSAAEPTANAHLATKKYVDSGFDSTKAAVVTNADATTTPGFYRTDTSTANLPYSYYNGTLRVESAADFLSQTYATRFSTLSDDGRTREAWPLVLRRLYHSGTGSWQDWRFVESPWTSIRNRPGGNVLEWAGTNTFTEGTRGMFYAEWRNGGTRLGTVASDMSGCYLSMHIGGGMLNFSAYFTAATIPTVNCNSIRFAVTKNGLAMPVLRPLVASNFMSGSGTLLKITTIGTYGPRVVPLIVQGVNQSNYDAVEIETYFTPSEPPVPSTGWGVGTSNFRIHFSLPLMIDLSQGE